MCSGSIMVRVRLMVGARVRATGTVMVKVSIILGARLRDRFSVRIRFRVSTKVWVRSRV